VIEFRLPSSSKPEPSILTGATSFSCPHHREEVRRYRELLMLRFRLPLSLISATLIFTGPCSAQDANAFRDPQYLANYLSPHCLYRMKTPSFSLSVPRSESPYAPSTQGTGVPDPSGVGGPQSQWQLDEVCFLPLPQTETRAVPIETPNLTRSTIFNAGVGEITTASSLRDVGYGISLAELASYWRTHKPHAVHVYTNADIARLPHG
jgi:hypothetical protein